VLLLFVLGAGYVAMKLMRGPSEPTTANVNEKTPTAGSDLVAAPHEITRYWLEVESEKGVSTTTASSVVTLNSGQSFKLHFSPSERGYLYIIGPGRENLPTVFLTAKPDSKTGLKTNEVKSGLDFSFPGGKNWITLDKKAGQETYTIIFSPEPLSAPAFLAAEGVHVLSPDEQIELESFRSRYKSNTASTDTMGEDIASSDTRPFVSVKVPQSRKESEPVIFDVRVEHK
jgi:hypothetical protein